MGGHEGRGASPWPTKQGGAPQQPLLFPAWLSDLETPRLSPSIPGEERPPWEVVMVTRRDAL